MSPNGSVRFWSAASLAATAIGSLFFMLFAHAGEPKHPAAAHEKDVGRLEVRLEGVAVDVENNKSVLQEVKVDLKALRVQQNQDTEEILRAIRNGR